MKKAFNQQDINKSMEEHSKDSRNSKTGYKTTGNSALSPGIKNTKGKR
ncbi:hypothetical protein KQI89_11410 [Clostridium sp. MSJ-4]|uniref:DUF4023 domain-containing protein n=1 Tax=Clostridium simiarum TaxID=2841506 RepID=A0ABS6F1J1_9CLOT|nr:MULTISPECIES: hypothetical protein [Clostridium]MBU5592365.1 hypothetical protein [Clostridium simiarum]